MARTEGGKGQDEEDVEEEGHHYPKTITLHRPFLWAINFGRHNVEIASQKLSWTSSGRLILTNALNVISAP